jgi:gamma-glutamylcyclotransferase (GGCT)/AIG2-like uncharacterized protein YtfP
MNVNHVLVYGTLRRGERANSFLDDSEFLGEVTVPNAVMFDLGSFPGIHLNQPEFSITAELYRVDNPKIIDRLDGYEGFDPYDPKRSLYLREVVNVNGVDAFIYVYNGAAPRSPRIVTGDWKQRVYHHVESVV